MSTTLGIQRQLTRATKIERDARQWLIEVGETLAELHPEENKALLFMYDQHDILKKLITSGAAIHEIDAATDCVMRSEVQHKRYYELVQNAKDEEKNAALALKSATALVDALAAELERRILLESC